MKNFEIKNIKNRQRYEMPDRFFEELQRKVVNKTVIADQSLTIPKKTNLKTWLFAAAACFALIVGTVYILPNLEQQTSLDITQNKDQKNNAIPAMEPINNEASLEVITLLNTQTNSEKSVVHSKKKIKMNSIASGNNSLVAVSNLDSKNPQLQSKNDNYKITANIVKNLKAQDQIDIILASLSEEEIALLAKNSDQDVYLDLYN